MKKFIIIVFICMIIAFPIGFASYFANDLPRLNELGYTSFIGLRSDIANNHSVKDILGNSSDIWVGPIKINNQGLFISHFVEISNNIVRVGPIVIGNNKSNIFKKQRSSFYLEHEFLDEDILDLNINLSVQDVLIKKSHSDKITTSFDYGSNSIDDITYLIPDVSLDSNKNSAGKILNINNAHYDTHYTNNNPLPTKFIISLPEKVYNKIMINAVSGDIEIENVNYEELYISSVSGAINIDNCEHNVKIMELNNISGDIRISKITNIKDLSINSISGNVILASSVTKADVSTISGDIKLNTSLLKNHTINSSFKNKKNSYNTNHVIGKGQNAITLFTTSGDIKLI